jgi:hypothetical protein
MCRVAQKELSQDFFFPRNRRVTFHRGSRQFSAAVRVIFKAMDDAGYFLTSPAPFYIAKQAAINAARGAALQDNIVIAIVFFRRWRGGFHQRGG